MKTVSCIFFNVFQCFFFLKDGLGVWAISWDIVVYHLFVTHFGIKHSVCMLHTVCWEWVMSYHVVTFPTVPLRLTEMICSVYSRVHIVQPSVVKSSRQVGKKKKKTVIRGKSLWKVCGTKIQDPGLCDQNPAGNPAVMLNKSWLYCTVSLIMCSVKGYIIQSL